MTVIVLPCNDGETSRGPSRFSFVRLAPRDARSPTQGFVGYSNATASLCRGLLWITSSFTPRCKCHPDIASTSDQQLLSSPGIPAADTGPAGAPQRLWAQTCASVARPLPSRRGVHNPIETLESGCKRDEVVMAAGERAECDPAEDAAELWPSWARLVLECGEGRRAGRTANSRTELARNPDSQSTINLSTDRVTAQRYSHPRSPLSLVRQPCTLPPCSPACQAGTTISSVTTAASSPSPAHPTSHSSVNH